MIGGKRKGAGRPPGSKADKTRKTSTITIWPECWEKLDEIGPSRGKAIEKLLKFWADSGI